MQTTTKETAEKTIVAFHIGRGGMFNNPGHRSFLGQKNIGNFVNDLFLVPENAYDVGEKIKGKRNLEDKFEAAINGEAEAIAFFEKIGLPLGEMVYTDGSSNHVGLSVKEEESGIGRINIDEGYDTTYTCFLSDCDENEMRLIRDSNEFHWIDSDVRDFIIDAVGEKEEA